MRLILLVALLLAGCQVGPSFSDPIEGTMLAKKPGFSCKLPSGWVKDDLDPNRPDGSSWRNTADTAKVRLSYASLPATPLEEVVKATLADISTDTRVKGFKLEKQGTLTVAGTPAQEFIYTATVNQRDRWHREIYVAHGQRLVMITFLANTGQQDAFAKDFQGVLDSWKWE